MQLGMTSSLIARGTPRRIAWANTDSGTCLCFNWLLLFHLYTAVSAETSIIGVHYKVTLKLSFS